MLSWLITLQTLFHEINLFKYNHRRFGNICFIPDLISEYFQPVYIFIERVTLTVTLFRSHLLISHFFHLLLIRHFVTDHWKSLNHWKIIIPNKYDETAVRSRASFGVPRHVRCAISGVPWSTTTTEIDDFSRQLKYSIYHIIETTEGAAIILVSIEIFSVKLSIWIWKELENAIYLYNSNILT